MLLSSDNRQRRGLFRSERDIASRATGRARTALLVAIFITAQVTIIAVGATALEGVSALRAYATGEAQWSKAQKRAVISLMHYAGSHDARDLVEYREAMKVIDGDTRARQALERAIPDLSTAWSGFLAGLNAPQDISGLSWGFIWLHNWAPFAQAVEDWRRADGLTAELSYLSGSLRGAIEAGAPVEDVRAILARLTTLDHRFGENEYRFAVHMGDASRAAKAATLLFMEAVSLFVCLVVGVLVRHIAEAGARAEARAKNDAARARDFAELGADWICELDAELCVTYMSPGFAKNALDADPVGRRWLALGEGFAALNKVHGEILARHLPFRGHQFRQDTGGPVFIWSVAGKPMFDDEGVFAGYRIVASDITDLVREQTPRTDTVVAINPVARVA